MMENTQLMLMIDEIKMKLLTRFNNALEKELSAETLGMVGEIIAKFEENEIKRSRVPVSSPTATTGNKKEVL